MPSNERPLDHELIVDLTQEEFQWLSDMAEAMDMHMLGVLRIAMRVGMLHLINGAQEDVVRQIERECR
jgi:hypothetical protein